MLKNWKWNPPSQWRVIKTIDLHTGGEPLRVITDGLPPIPGKGVLEKRRWFRDNLDFIRKGLMWEPRGHADMYGAVITEAVTEDGDFSTFFLHNEGYSTMCGHAMIALVKLVLDTHIIRKDGDNPVIKIDAPPGRITAVAHRENGVVTRVSFRNVPSFVLYEDKVVEVDGIGEVKFDLAYGGAFYAFCDAEALGLKLDATDHNRLIDYGRRIKKGVSKSFKVTHPFEEDLSFLYGTIFTGKPSVKSNHSRNVCIFADGEVDRSSTGSGVSARAAIHYSRNQLMLEESAVIESILGTVMEVKVLEETQYGGFKAVIPEVTGTASIIGQNEFYFDPKDPLCEGFILR